MRNEKNKTSIFIYFYIIATIFIFPKESYSQDNTVVDIPLLRQLEFMANKATQLDTIAATLHAENLALKNVVMTADSTILLQDSTIANQSYVITNLEFQNSILTENNSYLLKRSDKCASEAEKKDKTITRLKSSKRNSIGLNIGLGILLTVAIVSIVDDSN